MLILGLETSCDETAAAVVADGRRVLSSVVATQFELHAQYGGIVPEIAARRHLANIMPVTRAALDRAGVRLADIDAFAVTQGPGLIGALVIGMAFGKALAYALKRPLAGVHHLESHILAAFLAGPWRVAGLHLLDQFGIGHRTFDLDARTTGVAGAARASPHSLVQEFLNRSEGHLWGFVSNGLRLRILRDNASLTRQAYVELDLEAMLDGEAFADFSLL